MKKAFYPWATASLGCMLVIFLFSAQPAEASGELSGSLTRTIIGGCGSGFPLMDRKCRSGCLMPGRRFCGKALIFLFFLFWDSVWQTLFGIFVWNVGREALDGLMLAATNAITARKRTGIGAFFGYHYAGVRPMAPLMSCISILFPGERACGRTGLLIRWVQRLEYG